MNKTYEIVVYNLTIKQKFGKDMQVIHHVHELIFLQGGASGWIGRNPKAYPALRAQ